MAYHCNFANQKNFENGLFLGLRNKALVCSEETPDTVPQDEGCVTEIIERRDLRNIRFCILQITFHQDTGPGDHFDAFY